LLPFALTGVFVDQHSTNSITQHSDGHKQISSEILGLAEFDEDSLPEEEHEQDAYQPELPIAVFYNRIFKLHFSGLGHHFIASTSGKDRCIAMQCFRC
jgi:hypothetical protein